MIKESRLLSQFMLLRRAGKTYKFEQTRGYWDMKRLEMLLNHFIATRSCETDKKGVPREKV